METILKELRNLSNKQILCLEEAGELRKKQIKLCKKELIGKCYRWKDENERLIEGQEYGHYICFTKLIEKEEDGCGYYLSVTHVSFILSEDKRSMGVSICEDAFIVDEDADYMLNAEEISPAKFRDAFCSAYIYLGGTIEKVE